MKSFILTILMFFAAFTMLVAQSGNNYENGQAKSEGLTLNGKKSGEWKYFHDNGQVMREGIYQGGEPSGLWKEYYRSGQLKSEGKYLVAGGKSVKTGLWTTYHKNGAKEFEGKFSNGKQVGTWFEYNTLGIQIKKTVH